MSNEVDIKVTASGGNKAAQEIERAKGAGVNLQNTISGIGSTARGLLAADFITQIGEKAKESFSSATEAASSLGESMNAVDRIFGTSAGQIHKWGETQANAFGLSERAFNQMATPLGASLRNAGIEMSKTTDLTIKLTERASDMASVFNTSVQGALMDIQAALRGEADPIEKYGVAVNEAAVSAEALAMSGKKSVSELNNQDKALARVNIIMKQTNNLAGDFKATSDGLANSQRIANAQIEEAKAKLGQGLLPVLASAAKAAGALAEGFSQIPAPVQTVGAVVLGLGAAFVFLAPKLLAARDAWKELDSQWTKSDTKLGRVTTGIVHTAGKLAVLAAAAQVASVALGSDLNPNVEELAANLKDYEGKSKDASEATRLLGDKFQYLKDNSYYFKHDWGTDLAAGITTVIEDWTGLSNVMDDSHRKTTERVQALDAALARLVQQGRAGEARATFNALASEMSTVGVSVDQLKAGLPQYAAAQAQATRSTGEAAKAIAGQRIELEALHDALRKQTDPLFALIKAQEDLTDAQKGYNEAIKEHGKSSPEAAEALRNMASAAIALAGASSDAQGVFQGHLTPAMQQVLIQAGFTEAQLKLLEEQFRAATAAGDAFAKNYNATINVRVRDESGRITKALEKSGDYSSGVGGRASGGPGSGQMVVGEYGRPEIVDFEKRTVYNANQTQRMLAGGWGGGNGGAQQLEVNLNINITGANREFVQFMKAVVDAEGGGSVVKAFSRQQYQN